MAYDGRQVANFVLDYCSKAGRQVDHLSLQKIVYFCHVWSLVKLKRPLVRHKFEAWQHGTVLPYLYREFTALGAKPISTRATQIDPIDGKSRVVEYRFDTHTAALLEEIVEFYSRMRASDLVTLSHVESGPWHQVWNHPEKIRPGMKIADEEIGKFYSKVNCPFSLQ